MFNVLDKDGKKIQVEKIDPKNHRHLSGREFTSEEVPTVKTTAKTKKVEEKVEEKKEVKPKKKTISSKTK